MEDLTEEQKEYSKIWKENLSTGALDTVITILHLGSIYKVEAPDFEPHNDASPGLQELRDLSLVLETKLIDVAREKVAQMTLAHPELHQTDRTAYFSGNYNENDKIRITEYFELLNLIEKYETEKKENPDTWLPNDSFVYILAPSFRDFAIRQIFFA